MVSCWCVYLVLAVYCGCGCIQFVIWLCLLIWCNLVVVCVCVFWLFVSDLLLGCWFGLWCLG